jgi:hypothetical protein
MGIFLFITAFRPILEPTLLSNRYQKLFLWRYIGWGVKLTTYLHLVPRSRIRGAAPPLPQYAFME